MARQIGTGGTEGGRDNTEVHAREGSDEWRRGGEASRTGQSAKRRCISVTASDALLRPPGRSAE